MRLDKRTNWDDLAEAATRHFAKRAAMNAAPRERMAAHPSPATVLNSGTVYSTYSRRDQAISFNARRS